MNIVILGMGPSMADYKGGGDLLLGVNDVWKFHQVDHLVVQNSPGQFQAGRAYWIRRSSPLILWSSVQGWEGHPAHRVLPLISPRGTTDFQDLDRFAYSVFSPFTCLDMAVKFGASRIWVFGVDLVGHPVLGEESKLKKCLVHLENFLDVCPVPVVWAPSSPLASRLSSRLEPWPDEGPPPR
mgnify:FL=1